MTNLKIRQKLNYNRKQFKAIMNREERDFLNNLKSSINDWRYSYECYHEQVYFCVDITIEDIDEWGENADEIWDAISEVCDEWNAGIDSNSKTYYVALKQ